MHSWNHGRRPQGHRHGSHTDLQATPCGASDPVSCPLTPTPALQLTPASLWTCVSRGVLEASELSPCCDPAQHQLEGCPPARPGSRCAQVGLLKLPPRCAHPSPGVRTSVRGSCLCCRYGGVWAAPGLEQQEAPRGGRGVTVSAGNLQSGPCRPQQLPCKGQSLEGLRMKQAGCGLLCVYLLHEDPFRLEFTRTLPC